MTYTKYSAGGNGFIISHSFIEKDYKTEAIKLCNRTEGTGADGFVVLVPNSEADFKWLFYSSDESDASMCRNAIRAVTHYAYTNGLITKNQARLLTGVGIIKAVVENDIVETQLAKVKVISEEFSEDGFIWYLVDAGVPHLIAIVDDLNLYDHELCTKMKYKYNTDVSLAKIENKTIKIRAYERGVEGETLACGTGMATSFLRANSLKLVNGTTFVYPESGEELTLSIKDNAIYFRGAVKKVFTVTL